MIIHNSTKPHGERNVHLVLNLAELFQRNSHERLQLTWDQHVGVGKSKLQSTLLDHRTH